MTSIEHVFDHLGVSQPAVVPSLQQLRERMRRLERPTTQVELAAHPSVAHLPRLQGGGSYEVSDLALAMALLAGPTQAGDWCAVVGVPEFGAEAAAGLGVDLSRVVLVPAPGEQWLDVVAVLTDVVPLVLVQPTESVGEAAAARLGARLRRRDAVLLVHGGPSSWPRCHARLRATSTTWTGLGDGHGRLRARELTVQVREGATTPRTSIVHLPGASPDLVPGVPTTAAPARVDHVWEAG